MKKFIGTFLVIILQVSLAFATGNEPVVTPLPNPKSSQFGKEGPAHWKEEGASILGRYFPDDFVYVGDSSTSGLHGTSGTCISPAFGVEAFVNAGPSPHQADRVGAKSDGSGGTVAINYSALGVPGCSSGTTIVTVMACSNSPGGNWHQAANSNYYINWLDTNPDTPGRCASLMRVTITAGAIASVQDIRKRKANVLPIYDIKETGAKCDNTTDDWEALQALFNKVALTGGTIIHTGGICKVVGPHRIDYTSLKSVRLMGFGYGGGFRWEPHGDDECAGSFACEFVFFPAEPFFNTAFINIHGLSRAQNDTLQGVVIENISIDCGGPGPSVPLSTNLNSRRRCLNVYYASDVWIRGNHVKNTAGEGIYVNQFYGDPWMRNTWEVENIVTKSHIDAINDSSFDNFVIGNKLNIGYNAIEGCRGNCVVTGNYVTDFTATGILAITDSNSITSNIIHNTPTISLSNSGGAIIVARSGGTTDFSNITVTGNLMYYDNPATSFDPSGGASVGVLIRIGEPNHAARPKNLYIGQNTIMGYQECIRISTGNGITAKDNRCISYGASTPQRFVHIFDSATLNNVEVYGNSFSGDTTNVGDVMYDVSARPHSLNIRLGYNWVNGTEVDGRGQSAAVGDDTATPLLQTYGSGHTFTLYSTNPITRTDFPGWNDGDEIVMLFADGKQTIDNNSNIQTIDGRPWNAPLGSLSAFKRVTNRWIEAGRTLPAGVALCVNISETTATLNLSIGSPGHCYYITNSAPTTINNITFPTCCDVPFSLYFLDANTTLAHNAGGTGNIRLLGQTNFKPGLAHTITFLPAQSIAWQTGYYCDITTGSGCPHLRMLYATLNAITLVPGNSGYCSDCTVGAPCTGSGGGAMFIVIESGAKRCF